MNNKEVVFIKQKKMIRVVSIVLPIAIAALFGIKIEGYDFGFLPSVYSTFNGLTAILLLVAVAAAKRKNIKLHELIIKICMLFSLLFLILYIVYHSTSGDTKYGGDLGYIYYPILITHIILSIGVVPLALFSYLYGINNKIEQHRKLVEKTFPIWLYVTVSGVIVYFMISPYY